MKHQIPSAPFFRTSLLSIFIVLVFLTSCDSRKPLIEIDPDKDFITNDLVDADTLESIISAGNESHSSSIVILKNGKLVGKWYAGGNRKKIEAMSVTKSIVNLAVGRLVSLGKIKSIDEAVHSFYPEWNHGLKAKVSLRHLLNHTSGLQANQTTQDIYASPDVVRFALASEVIHEPGIRFFYNNKATNLIAGIIEKASGQAMHDFLGEDLFKHLGIIDFDWTLDSAGNPHGMAGLQIYPEDLAKLGQLTLDRGNHNGE